ncbi:MAG: thiol-disulfide oxidoreductase DCC family protein [Bacteroidetes bacterium]|nr:thiol-disulfide oxidoreductase DCC family protein [Bacteroidota bacterium]HET6244208.1 thiol-disulfide oxidoreductase DCC family protein [Bacteroidia bacterium]
MKELKAPVILYDGVCNFCNAIVTFIIKHDKEKKFLFAPIQSKQARLLLRNLGEPFANLKTVYLVDSGQIYKKSGAVFKIVQKLHYPWKLLSLFKVLPLGFTDYLYSLIAKNRYHWFGKTNEIIKPNEKVKERFLAD